MAQRVKAAQRNLRRQQYGSPADPLSKKAGKKKRPSAKNQYGAHSALSETATPGTAPGNQPSCELSKQEMKTVTLKLPGPVRDKLRKDAASQGLTLSEYLRMAWRLAKRNPELLKEVEAEEQEYQRSLSMSCWHPDAKHS